MAPETLIIFDVDGTLIQSIAMEAECYVAACRDLFLIDDVDTNWSSYKSSTDPGVATEIFERCYHRTPGAQELRSFHDVYVEKLHDWIGGHPGCLTETPGASQLLAELKARCEFELVIATGAWRKPIGVKIAGAGLVVPDLPITSADDAVEREQIVALARCRAMRSSAPCILVGDAVWDVAAAKRLDIAFLGVGEGVQAERLQMAGASHVVNDFTNVEAVIDQFRSLARGRKSRSTGDEP